MTSRQTWAAAFLAPDTSPLAALSQIAVSLDLTLAESVGCAFTLDLQLATACATPGLLAGLAPGVDVAPPEVVVVAEVAGVVLAGVLVDLFEDELLPQPAANAPVEASTNDNTNGLQIIDPPPLSITRNSQTWRGPESNRGRNDFQRPYKSALEAESPCKSTRPEVLRREPRRVDTGGSGGI
ncbi:MAG: hypothetical protein E6G56_04740 [Actinobacteria bacterium]|nr:MAG: hypothetical protein E6G56_04740 [Actinomycetota bacterium]